MPRDPEILVPPVAEHIIDIYITELTQLGKLRHNIIDIFIIETYHN